MRSELKLNGKLSSVLFTHREREESSSARWLITPQALESLLSHAKLNKFQFELRFVRALPWSCPTLLGNLGEHRHRSHSHKFECKVEMVNLARLKHTKTIFNGRRSTTTEKGARDEICRAAVISAELFLPDTILGWPTFVFRFVKDRAKQVEEATTPLIERLWILLALILSWVSCSEFPSINSERLFDPRRWQMMIRPDDCQFTTAKRTSGFLIMNKKFSSSLFNPVRMRFGWRDSETRRNGIMDSAFSTQQLSPQPSTFSFSLVSRSENVGKILQFQQRAGGKAKDKRRQTP